MALSALRGMGDSPVSSEHGQVARATWEGKLKFIPERYAKNYTNWHENIRDWCISRQLWWGHRIPVWRMPEGRLADRLSTEQFANILEKMTHWSDEGRMAMAHRAEAPEARAEDIADRKLPFAFACVRDPADREIVEELERHGAVQDPDVLDTWFSSGLWPLSTMGWPKQTKELATWNPTNVLCTAREIITLWVSRMVMFNLYFHEPVFPRATAVLRRLDSPHGAGWRGSEDVQEPGERRRSAGHHRHARRRRDALHPDGDDHAHAGRAHAGRARSQDRQKHESQVR
jgi:hypothetical protein